MPLIFYLEKQRFSKLCCQFSPKQELSQTRPWDEQRKILFAPILPWEGSQNANYHLIFLDYDTAKPWRKIRSSLVLFPSINHQ